MCPWDQLRPANLRLCEAPVCGWITEPANTWTNVGFLIVAVWVWRAARRDGAPRAGLLAPIAVATALASAAFHATSTLFGQLLDQSTMFFESSLFLALNLDRLRPLPRPALISVYSILVAGSTAALVRWERAGIALFAGHVVGFLSIEAWLALRRPRAIRYGALASVGATFACAWALWWLDRLGVLCRPDNHLFTAHGAWHLLGALSFAFWYRHYAQLERGGRSGIIV